MNLLLNKNIAGLELAASTRLNFLYSVRWCQLLKTKECLASAVEQLENDPAKDSQDLEESDMANYW